MRARVERLELPRGRRTLAVSDIHGNLPLLKGLLDKVAFSREDILLVLGDILERNAGSLATLQFLIDLGRTHTVRAVLGNCDNLVLSFLEGRGDISGEFFQRWFRRVGERSALVQMARLAGVSLAEPGDYPAARAAMARAFPEELAYLRSLPQILVNDDYLFVHGGVPREDRLEELDAYSCMKNDDFLGQGLSFRRWVVVGHWPVTLYREKIPSAAPILLEDRHIASIDGGCTLKWDGQLNALILPAAPGEGFTWTAFDGLASVTALTRQKGSRDSINIRWSEREVEVLEWGEEFCRCRHVRSGRTVDILTEYLWTEEGPQGPRTVCEDSTDYCLDVFPGDRLHVVRRTSQGILAKKEGVTGWYWGEARG